MRALRTPDDRFENLPGWTFAPRYTEVPDGDGGALRVHHVDEGPAEREPDPVHARRAVVGVPLPEDDPGAHRARVFAPSLPTSSGFGRSDKPTERDDYTYQRHVDWMTAWLRRSRPAARDARRARTGAG